MHAFKVENLKKQIHFLLFVSKFDIEDIHVNLVSININECLFDKEKQAKSNENDTFSNVYNLKRSSINYSHRIQIQFSHLNF